MSTWLEILGRVLDGEVVSSEEAVELHAALLDDSHWEEARRWMQFEFTLTGYALNEKHVDVSRDRLLARVILREKHAEVTGHDRTFADRAVNTADGKLPGPSSTPQRRTGKFVVLAAAASLRQTRRYWKQAVVAIAIGLIVAGAFWPESFKDSYAGPKAQGDFRILGATDAGHRQEIERGDRIISGGQGVQLELGDYCRLELDAHSDVTVHGAPHQEVVELHQGRLRARITPDHGKFQVQTPLGPVTVKGTEFDTTVEYPNGMPDDLSPRRVRKVVVTVAVASGSVLCEMSDTPVLLQTGNRQVFEREVEHRRTSGEVTSVTDTTVTIRVNDRREQATFHIGDSTLTIHEAGQLLKGDRVTITWDEQGGQRWIRDIDGEGVLEGTVTALGDAWLEIQTRDKGRVKLQAPWRGGNPADGGGPDRDITQKIAALKTGNQVAVAWAIPEGRRVIDIRLRNAADLARFPPELHGLTGRVVGRLLSRNVERGELTLNMIRVDRVGSDSTARNPQAIRGRTLTVDGVTGRYLDLLRNLKENEGVLINVRHVRGDRLRFAGDELKHVEIGEEAADRPREAQRPERDGETERRDRDDEAEGERTREGEAERREVREREARRERQREPERRSQASTAVHGPLDDMTDKTDSQ